MWYNLSHINGNPFTDVEREFAPANGCPTVNCVAENDGSACDYEIQTDCGTKDALNGYLCGRGSGGKELSAVGIWNLPKVDRLA
jgi:hypothetical protein